MTNDDDLIVTGRDCIDAGFCGVGIRNWMISHGKDFRYHIKHGMPASELVATGDPLALRAVNVARERVASGWGK